MDRRRFLQSLAALAPAPLAWRLHAAPGADARFLLVFLRGGLDSANVLVPASSSFYYESRPGIAIGRPGSGPLAGLALDADWALHPALGETILPLYRAGEAAFVPFAGTDDTSRSHFETQDRIEFGQDADGRRDFRSGFLNRLAAELAGGRAVAFTEQPPVAFRGNAKVAHLALKTLGRSGVDARQGALIAKMYGGSPIGERIAEGLSTRDEAMRNLGAEMEAASRGALSARGFEAEAMGIARLMKAQYNLGFADVGGWDTHVGEGGAQGYLADRLGQLGRGLAAYARELGGEWRNTVVVVMSEFGRTFRENGNRGTDHGHGGAIWVLGGAVRGGGLRGEQRAVRRDTLFEDRDLPVLNEYRAMLGSLFARLYGLDAAALDRVFPGAKPRDPGLV